MSETDQQLEYLGHPLNPYRIGVLIDYPDTPGVPFPFKDAIALAFDEARARDLMERPVELVVRQVLAQPWNDVGPMIRAYRELVEEVGVLGVIGPLTTDNSLPLLPEIERAGVPTCSICGSSLFVGRAAFSLANGGLLDEPPVIAAWLAAEGYRNVALLRETTQIGEEFTSSFRLATAPLGISVLAEAAVYSVMSPDELTAHLERLRTAEPDALVYLGLGALNPMMRGSLEAAGWDPPRIQTTGFVGATYSSVYAELLEGWVGVDQFDERNQVFARVLDRFEKRHGYRPENSAASCGYDIGHAFAVALGRMRVASPAGLLEALETVRRLPACTGAPGTVVTFGPQDHRGFKGADFLVLRRARGGTTELVGTAPVAPWEQP